MTKLSLLIQMIANDAGIPFSKAEKILKTALERRLPPTNPGEDWPAGVCFGLLEALKLLGANGEMVDKCLWLMLAEAKNIKEEA